MKQKSPYWLIGFASLLFVGLIASQLFWVFDAAEKQEEQFNKQTQLALESIEEKVQNDADLCYMVSCCLMEDKKSSCSAFLSEGDVWTRTDSMIAAELTRFEIDLNYNFDFCFSDPSKKKKFEAYEQNMDKVFEDSGIILFLEFPDKSRFLRNQIGPVFISAVLMTLFLSILFVMVFKFYRKERAFSQRTRDFINNMTHEFQTPLTNISLANGMIGRSLVKEDAKSKIIHYTGIIDEENARLVKNCDDLLQMARIENLDAAFTEKVDTHAIIEKVVSSKQISVQNFTVDFNLMATNFNVLGSESLFYNSISNLIDNAVKYSTDTPKLTITTLNEKGLLNIKITDNGIGMKAEHIDHIFDKFYRVSEGDKHNVKGFGLGLAFVKMVVTKMKGNIKVESKIGLGTTFNIIIPTA
jgi:two-component system, OmpR family, phosphate regulon sensor histidine kinase PhoR